MSREAISIEVPHQGAGHVSAIVDAPGGPLRAVYVLAHGSGAPMTSELLETLGPLIAERAGIAVVRFNYAYAERMVRTGKRLPPERRPALEAVHGAALEFARNRFPKLPLFGGGKSLGGRISTLMAADGTPFDGLVLLGYPLHPAGKLDRLRVEHFPSIETPALFLQGTRDALADLDLLERSLPDWTGPTELHVVEGADHSFAVLRRSGRTPHEVHDEIANAVDRWVGSLLGDVTTTR
ncbi:MAG: alpha/beta family hydrolase [Planctomycetota bacterium]